MKSIYILSTKLWVYLTEIPILILLWVSISSNHLAEGALKYYPLIIFLSLSVIFIMVYFFSMISISFEEIRYHGLFSSKDSAFITEKKTLLIRIKPRRNLDVELYGDAGAEPAFDWMKAEDVLHRDICLFRGRANGSYGTAKRILKFFKVPKEELELAFNEGFSYEDDAIHVSSTRKNEVFEIEVKFKITIV